MIRRWCSKRPISLFALLVFLFLLVWWRPVIPSSPVGRSSVPPFSEQSKAVHDRGNIRITLQNWGHIGGLEAGDPAGEWPAYSGRNYLQEIKYWIGTGSDNKVRVADTDEDFRPLPDSEGRFLIHLSTDPATYHFDSGDAIAHGWRIWDALQQLWVPNQIWHPRLRQFLPGGPVSGQDSYYRFSDHRQGSAPLNLVLSHTTYQWNYEYNQDALFVVIEIGNPNPEPYTDVTFALFADFDVGGVYGSLDGGTDDRVGFDSDLGLAWMYDADGIDPVWGESSPTGLMGTLLLETPEDIGLTTFVASPVAAAPTEDGGRWAMMSSRQIGADQGPGDFFYVQAVNGITLPAGGIVRVVYAILAGRSEALLRDNAESAARFYADHWVGPAPPEPVNLSAVAGDGRVVLSWDGTSETSRDPITGENDFVGYEVYKSSDQGQSWGPVVGLTARGEFTYRPLAVYEQPPFERRLIDTHVRNGFEYWYSVVSYDRGQQDAAGNLLVPPLRTARATPGTAPNTVAVMPRIKAATELTNIKVVPNPYLVQASWEASGGQRKLAFTRLPGRCTIRIYSLAGDLIQELYHRDGSGMEFWDLINRNGQEIVAGVYLFHVESSLGNHVGRFVVVK